MGLSLNSLKGGVGDYIQGSMIWIIQGDTRSLDYSSYDRSRCKPKPGRAHQPRSRLPLQKEAICDVVLGGHWTSKDLGWKVYRVLDVRRIL